MIQSMTGFGRGEAADEHFKVTVEMKSVNHRYLDFNIRIPHKFAFYESRVRQQAKQFATRGKIDMFVMIESLGESDISIVYNRSVAGAYLEGVRQLALDHSMKFKTDAYQIASLPEVFTMKDAVVDEEVITPLIDQAVKAAGEQFRESRCTEGEILSKDMRDKLNLIRDYVDKIETRYPQILEEYSARIRKKAEELLADHQIDERILASEMVIYADKLCVDEEMIRIKTHIQHMKECLDGDESNGRKLDFLTQELNREANTILSKSSDVTIANYGIELKTLIEKVREQVQNIE
ncbi:MAG: YicC/YloC family endoribonuclease [Eubacterium sp.]|nr:YicC/YloC family endoribonuclease [Eubacterium sp.]